MFKNSVFRISVNTKEWFKATAVRAVKTMAQVAGSMFTIGMAVSEIDWGYVASVAFVAGVLSILTSLAGIPEVTVKEETNNE